jgi:hypothetical protein
LNSTLLATLIQEGWWGNTYWYFDVLITICAQNSNFRNVQLISGVSPAQGLDIVLTFIVVKKNHFRTLHRASDSEGFFELMPQAKENGHKIFQEEEGKSTNNGCKENVR